MNANQTSTRGLKALLSCLAAGAVLTALAGCGKPEGTASAPAAAPGQGAPAADGMVLCNFKGGADTALVTVEAYYPGGHGDTLAAVKSLLQTFPDKVKVEIVDWRTPEGINRRNATGLTCAGVVINGKNAFDLTVDGKPNKVLFIRGIDGEWTKPDLEAAVKQELAAAESKTTEKK